MKLRNLRLIAIAIFLFASFSFAPKLIKMTAAVVDSYEKINGQLLKLNRFIDRSPGHGEQAGSNSVVFEVAYTYTYDGIQYKAIDIANSCSRCGAETLRKVMDPIPEAGDNYLPIVLYVSKSNHARAFLIKPTPRDLIEQILYSFLWIVIAPLFFYFFTQIWFEDK